MKTSIRLSVVVVCYNMARELPRTLRTLSVHMQRDITAADYEIIVVDNGSTKPADYESCLRLGCNIRIHTIANGTPSPVPAINLGLEEARGELIGVMIDGARMASPRLLATALEASRLHPRPVVGTLAFHLGPKLQWLSIAEGYCQEDEDRLLDSVNWTEDGYRLFSISVLAGSSADGWFVMPHESNALFLSREQWRELGGYDPAFVMPGGGLANLDTWARAGADPAARMIMLLGEGTFHQVHGGIATNSTASKWDSFHDEYRRVRGKDFRPPTGTPLLIGRLHPAAIASMKHSTDRYSQLAEIDGTNEF